MKLKFVFSLGAALGVVSTVGAQSLEQDRRAILGTSGCYIVDYNYHEVEAIDPTYKLDSREYHNSVNPDFKKMAEMYHMLDPAVTADKYQYTMKEKIWVRQDSDNTIQLQHILFLTNKEGQLDFVMKHHAERWRYEADRTFEYVGQGVSKPVVVENSKGRWTREMQALDDSPRYSCTAAWDHTREFPTWTCANYSPIPGRESRDMNRKDYQGLDRIHSLTVYPNAWLDTQNNQKVYEKADGARVPFVKEKGRNWYTRIDDASCNVVDEFIEQRKGFWDITQSVWDKLLTMDAAITESKVQGPPRWMPINGGPLIVHPGRKMVQYQKGLEQRFIEGEDKQKLFDEVLAIIKRYQSAN